MRAAAAAAACVSVYRAPIVWLCADRGRVGRVSVCPEGPVCTGLPLQNISLVGVM